MSGKMTLRKLVERLEKGLVVSLSRAAWESIAAGLPQPKMLKMIETIDTGLAGQILLVQGPGPSWAIVEEPKPDERVIRPLASEAEARALIADRLAAYERMWDG